MRLALPAMSHLGKLFVTGLVFGAAGALFVISDQPLTRLAFQGGTAKTPGRQELPARQAREGMVSVLRSNVALPANTRISETDVRSELLPKALVPAHANLRLEDVVDKFTTESIPNNDVLVSERLTDVARSLESFLQERERFFSLRMDGLDAVSGLIKQQDRLDVLAIVPTKTSSACKTVASNVEVFAINDFQWEPAPRRTGTFETLDCVLKVTEEQACKLVMMKQIGARFILSLRSPSDNDSPVIVNVTLDELGRSEGVADPGPAH